MDAGNKKFNSLKKSKSPGSKTNSSGGKSNISTLRRPVLKLETKEKVVDNKPEYQIKIPQVPSDEDGKLYHQMFKEFVEDSSKNELEFPSTMNIDQRKKLHDIAEEFDLLHFSRGSKSRFITVQKKTHKQEDEWQYIRYIGLFGPQVNEAGNKDVDIVPPSQVNQRIKRDGPISHITYLNAEEVNLILKDSSLLKMLKDELKDTNEDGIELLMNYIANTIKSDLERSWIRKRQTRR